MGIAFLDEQPKKPSGNSPVAYDDGGNRFGPKSGVLRQIADVPIGVAGGVAGLIPAAVGLGDIATGGAVGDAVDAAGSLADKISLPDALRPTKWQDKIQSYYTPEMKAAKEAAHQSAVDAEQQAKDEGADWKGQIGASALGGLKGVAENPRAGLAFLTENYGGMKAIAKGTEKVLARYLPEIDAAVKAGTMTQAQANARVADLAGKISPVGEGILTAGQGAQQVRAENPNATAADYLLQAPAGFITGAIARGVGKIPGLENVEATMALNAMGRPSGFTGSVLKRAGKGVLSEGVLQEVPQSAQEQAWVNAGTGKPLQEGVGEAAVQGLIAGGAMGGGAAGMSGVANHFRASAAQGADPEKLPGQTPPAGSPSQDMSAQALVAEALAAEMAAQPATTSNAPAGDSPSAAPTVQTNQAGPAGATIPTINQGEQLNGDQAKITVAPEAGQQEGGEAAAAASGRADQPAQGGGNVSTGAGQQGVAAEAQKAETRAGFYERLAAEREQPGPAADPARAAQYRAKAAEIRAGAVSRIAQGFTTPAQPTTRGTLPQQATALDLPGSVKQHLATAPAAGAVPATAETERGKVGGALKAGQVVLTASGRKTTPFPKFQSKAGNTTAAHLRAADQWLLQNAADEARARGDGFNAPAFQADANLKSIPQASKDSAEEYLFGEQPAVQPSILKPLVAGSRATKESQTPEPKAAPTVKESLTVAPTGTSTIKSRQSPIQKRDDLVGAIMRAIGGGVLGGGLAGVSYGSREQPPTTPQQPAQQPVAPPSGPMGKAAVTAQQSGAVDAAAMQQAMQDQIAFDEQQAKQAKQKGATNEQKAAQGPIEDAGAGQSASSAPTGLAGQGAEAGAGANVGAGQRGRGADSDEVLAGVAPSQTIGQPPIVQPQAEATDWSNVDYITTWRNKLDNAIFDHDKVEASRLVSLLPTPDNAKASGFATFLYAFLAPGRIGSFFINKMPTSGGDALWEWRRKLEEPIKNDARQQTTEGLINGAQAKEAEQATQGRPAQPTTAANAAGVGIAGDKLNREWTAFSEDSGTLGIPRSEMPQVKAEHRGALANFLTARGVTQQKEEVPADSLLPTQAEFSPSKVKKAAGFVGGDRSILVSADNHVLDGHHQWMAKRESGEAIKIIRLNAPIKQLVDLAHAFPSSETANGATPSLAVPPQPTNAGPLPQQAVAMPVPAVKDSLTAPKQPASNIEGASKQPASTLQAPSIDVSTRPDQQLTYLSTNGRNGYKEAAIAEIARRGGKVAESTSDVAEEGRESANARDLESDQDRSWREYEENYAAVTGDIQAATDKNIVRAIGFASKAIVAYQKRAFAGDERAKNMIDSLNREIGGLEHELARRKPSVATPVKSKSAKKPAADNNPTPTPATAGDSALLSSGKGKETGGSLPKPTLEERKAAALERRKAKESATKAAEARTIAARAPEVSSLADRLKAAAATAVGSRKAALEARLARLEAAKAKEPTPVAKKARPAPIMQRDDIVGEIMRITGGDGIASSMARTIGGDSAPQLTKLRGLFTNRGQQDLDDLATNLQLAGYDVRDGNHLSELIREASFGNVAVSMERQERDKEAGQERQHRDMIRARAKKLGVKTVAVKFSDMEANVLAVEQKRHDIAVAKLEARDKARFDAALSQSESLVSDDEIRTILKDLEERGINGRDKWREALVMLRQFADDARAKEQDGIFDDDATATTDEPEWFKDFDEEADSQSGARGATAASDAADEGRGSAAPEQGGGHGERGPVRGGSEADGQGDGQEAGFKLAGQSSAEIAADEAAKVAEQKAAADAAAQEAKDKKAVEQKALDEKVKTRAADPDNFQFGEDAKAAANPTGGLFDQPAKRPETAGAPSSEQGPATIASFTHTRTGALQYSVAFKDRVAPEVFAQAKALASRQRTRYSAYKQGGAVPGFLFHDEAKAKEFAAEIAKLVPPSDSVESKPAEIRAPEKKPETPQLPSASEAPATTEEESLGAMFDEALGDVFGEAEAAPEKPKSAPGKPAKPEKANATAPGGEQVRAPRKKKAAVASAVSAAKNAGMGLSEVAKGLNALFKPRPGTLGSGPSFDEKTYEAAKPYFIAGIQHFKQAGADIKDMMVALVTALRDQFGMDKDTALAMKPYVVRFMGDVKAGRVAYDEVGESQNGESGDRTTEVEGGGALAPVVADKVGGTGEGGQGGRGTVESGQGGGEGNTATDAGRGEAPRSGGNGSAGIHPSDAGGSGPGGRGTGGTGGTGSEVSVHLRGRAESRGRIPEANFEIGEDVGLGEGGQAGKYKDNVAAIKVLKAIEADRRRATAEEKKVLARYVGWGGIPNAFKNRVTGEIKTGWSSQVAELESLLTKDELRAASASTRNAHFTSKEVVGFMWQAARRLGFNGGMVLEPSVGTGNFIGLMPREIAGKSLVTGIELDSLTSRMARALYPRSNVVHSGFEKLALPDGGFSLAIGNPPFGAESLRFQHRPDLNSFSIHNQFFLGSLDAVEPGGLMAMVVSRYLLDAQDSSTRRLLAQKATLVGAVRLPGSAFKGNALTDVVTDVIFLRRRTAEEEARVTAAVHEAVAKAKPNDVSAQARRAAAEALLAREMGWTGTSKVKDPLGGDAMDVGTYFAENPQMIVGTMDRSGSMQHGADIDVKLAKGEKLADRLADALERLPSRDPREFSDEALARAEEMHAALGEALELSSSGAEIGSIRFDEEGGLVKVVERIGDKGESAMKKVPVNESTPWSPNLLMDMKGRWYSNTPKLKADGTPMKNGRFVVYTKKIYENEADIPASMRLGASKFERVKKLIAIRDLFVAQINLEVSRSATKPMEAHRAKLRRAYESFVKEHGYISENKNASIVSEMPDEGLLLSLESDFRPAITAAKAKASGIKAAPARAKPSAILSRPVAVPPEAASSAANAADALAISMSESGRISLARIADLLDVSQDEAKKQLTAGESPLAFEDPEQSGEIVERNAYLSGSVRRKLEAAKEAGLSANVDALEKIQPEQWTSDNVNPRVGANWIPPAVYSEFASQLIGSPVRITYSELTNTYDLTGESDSAASTATWGTKRAAFPELFSDMLNSMKTAIYDKNEGGGRTFNQTETDNAADKKRDITEAFDEWVFKDSKRRQELTQLFNDKFNTRVNRQYDGSHLTMPGKVPDAILSLRRSQKNGAWRGIIEDAVLYDHAVGAGKTFTAIARAVERRRMGISKKPMIVVPNHMVQEWATQAYRLYPGAKILAAGTKDLSAKNRRRLFAKIASGDWDAVIVPHSSFGFISVSPATEERFLNEQIDMANAALKEAEEEADPGSRFKPLSVKAAEALIDKLETRIAKVREATRDKLLTFEQMGVDDLTVDEAHEFKNLFYSTRMTDVRGLGPAAGSNKALDLYTKVRVIRETNGGLAFLSGTPISNSAVEMYTLMRYLAPDALEDAGLEHFDAFRSQFVNATPELEPTDSGVGLKMVTRLGRSWSNMRSLMEAYYSIADVVTNDDIKAWYAEDNPGQEFPLPKVKGGDRRTVAVDPTPTQLAILMDVVRSFDTLKNIQNPKDRNKERLRLMDRARKLSLHAKAVDPLINDEPGGKLDRAVDEVSAIFHKWTKDKGTQLVFLDRGLPKGKGDAAIIKEFDALQAAASEALANDNEEAYGRIQDKLAKFDENEINEMRAAQNGGWNAYQHLKDGLVAKGVPANSIAFIQDHHTDIAKKQLFEAVKDGTIRVLIGSTPRMGAGMNVQERLVALHHIDVTWKPSDIEQREGRIIRQGNLLLEKYGKDFEVEILAYVTERTVDAKLWSLNSMKLKMVNGVRYYDGQFEMDFEDEAAVGMAETAALASGDPLLLERFRLQSEVDMLLRQKKAHSRRRQSAEDSIASARRVAENEQHQLEWLETRGDVFDKAQAVIAADLATRKIEINGVAFGPTGHYGANKVIADAFAGLAEGEKLSMVIDGKTITTKGAAEAAVTAALGDSTPFFSEVGGKRIIARSDFARAIRDVIGHEFKDTPETAIGSIAGIPVVLSAGVYGFRDSKLVTLETASGNDAKISESADLSTGGSAAERLKPALVTVQNMRPLIVEFEKSLERMKRSEDVKNRVIEQAKKARESIPVLEAVLADPFKKAEELEQKKARLDVVEKELDGRTSSDTDRQGHQDVEGDAQYNASASGANISPADSAIYDMAAEGKSAADILDFISKGSRRQFNRYLAKALKNLGVSPTVTADAQAGFSIYSQTGNSYGAAYNHKTNAVALFEREDAEHHVLHEFTHAATIKAIEKGGPVVTQMRALFEHVKASGEAAGQYGLTLNKDGTPNLKEFVAEAFSNLKFQMALKRIAAPRGSSLKSAWKSFIRLVSRILGFKSPQMETALDEVMALGAKLMRANAQLSGKGSGTSFSKAADTINVDGTDRPRTNSNGKPIAGTDEALRNFWRWFSGSVVVDESGAPLVMYHGAKEKFTKFDASFADPTMRGIGFHVTSNKARAALFSGGNSPMEIYVRVSRPFAADRGYQGALEKEHGRYGSESAVASMKKEGFDGLEFHVKGEKHFAPFDANQIKSADQNNGEFSPDNPDINFNISGAPPAPAAAVNPWQKAKAKAAALLTPGRLDKAIYELQDKFIDLRRLRDHIKAIGGAITDMNDAYLGEELYHKRLAHRVETFAADELQPLMADMRSKGVAMEEFETFLHARHAPEANAEMAGRNPNQAQINAGQARAAATVRQLETQLQHAQAAGTATAALEKALNDARGELSDWNGAQAFQGTEDERRSLSGMSDAAAAAVMSGLSPEKRAKLDALAARVDAINAGTVKLLDDYGLMSKDALRAWQKTYRYYIPLHRDEAHPDSNSHPIGQGFSTKGDASKRRTGSNAKVTNILGHIAMQRESALTRGEKNHVMLKLYLMARQNPLPDVWKVGVVPMLDTIDKKTGFVKSVPDPLYKNRPNVVMLRIAGKDVAIAMNENNPEALRMAHALKNLDVDDLHYLIPVVGKITRYFAAINTQYNPIFGIVNMLRDTQEAALNLSTTPIAGKQGEVLRDTLSILKEVLKNKGRMPKTGQWATLFNELREVGGTTGYRDLFLDAESRSKALLDDLKALDRGKAAKALNSVTTWLSDYNEAMENATRLAAYKAALDSGMSKERAASLAKNLTVNFNRKGRQTRELGALYAFFNAAVQGSTRMVKTLSGPAGRNIMAGGVMLGAMNTLIGFAAMGGGDDGDDEWSKIPEFVKERSIIIPIGKQDYITIPMPLGFQFLPNIGRLTMEMAIYKDKTAGKQMASLFSVLADAFNPLGGSSPPLQLISPTVMDPFVALAQNRDWTGNPIYRENYNEIDPTPGFARAKDSATPIAKGVAEAINYLTGGTRYTPGGWSPTPDQLDYVVGQLTGGVGRELGKATSTVAAPFTGEELPAYKIPLVGRLYGNTKGASGESQKFYENITRANEAENEIKGRLKAGLSVTDFLQDNPTAMALAASGNAAERQASLLRSIRRGIVEQDPPDKAAQVRAVNEQIAAVMRWFNRSAAVQ